jgi:hypothetical protein
MSGSDAEAENCRNDIDDDYRIRRPSTSRAEVNASRLRELIVETRQDKIRNLLAVFELSIGNAYSSVHEELQYREVCARSVRICMTERHNIDVSRWLFNILHCFTKEKDEFVESILRGHDIRYCPACFVSSVRLSSLVLRPVVAVGRN